MKVKELLKTVNVAWSPPAQHPILLAAGTAAQQLDASFNTSASLDIYSLNLQQAGYDLELKATIASDHRFHKITWGAYGNSPSGIIVGGCDYGTIKIYSVAKLLANDNNCLISSPDRHTGPVRALDFNPFQTNLLATGATDSEIYIWDIVNTTTPMTPGSRSQPLEDVQYIAWNKQVQHILASTFSQRCVIWDLRKNEPIIKLTDTNSKVRWKVVQWHPNVATQLCLASEDDQAPVIELWDLRFATSPLKMFQNHQRGVLSIAWNPCDPDLLLSCAKDNRILCWNPNSDAPNGEVICELAQTNQWNFDVSWCPRHPGLVVGTSFDGHAVIYSLLGGQQQMSMETSNKIVDSFPGMDPFTQPPSVMQSEPAVILTKAPKWLKRPFGASFGFGGKLIIFENEPIDPNLPANSNRKVIISQVITQPELIQRSKELEDVLKTEQYSDYCKEKAEKTTDVHRKKIWNCVGVYFGENVAKEILELLGYDIETMNNKLNQLVPREDINNITEGVGNLNNVLNGNVINGSAAFDAIAQDQINKATTVTSINNNFQLNVSDDEDGLITQAILLGNIEAAVSLCFANKRYADAVILSMAAGPDLLARTQYRYFSEHSGALNSLINSLVSENWAEVVNNTDINCWKEVLIGIFTHSNPQERSTLCDMLGDRLASSDNPTHKEQAQICYICSGNLNKMVESSNVDIQEVVELVMIMQKALEMQGIRETQIEGKIASVLSQYAEMLASEGDLDAALNYLGNSQDEKIVMLKDRLYRALGYIEESKGVAKTPAMQNYYAQPRRSLQNPQNPLLASREQTRSFIDPNIAPAKQPLASSTNQFHTQQPQQSFGLSPLQPHVQSSMQYDQYQTSHYTPSSVSQPPPLPPPTTGSSGIGSRPPSAGPQARSKYLIDPSVKSTATYGQTGFPQQTMSYNQQMSPMTGYTPSNTYQPQVPIPGNTYPGQNFTTGLQESEPFKPVQPSGLPPLQNLQQNQMYDPIRTQPVSQAYGNESVYKPSLQSAGWNDPPVAKSRIQPVLALYTKNEMSAEHAGTRKWKAKHSKNVNMKSKQEYQPQNPILHPLRGAVAQPEQNVLPQEKMYADTQVPYNPQQYNQSIPNINAQFAKPVEPSQPAGFARGSEPEKPKAPIPEQHIHLKTVFDELKNQCYENAKNPQIKRKIEDVSKKLEVLYDCLRESKLSQNTLQGLHQISQMIQSGNYTGGLDLHTQLVSGPDFSQISSFMPGIKVLLLSALQLSVYIR
ncbi:protein transport protein Sec31A isoform X1 [Hylaeus anthracinus]|uniref:protein transport protein Sec31A isoform X1 n=1 Tax=Hylaeus anthracinus TaxID=313031 RepID=UPI0023B9920D|nr:protein transport protein Sec31A isoform X1 [Hylaeus anthracinus]XP_054008173.1 protein transport protein Sec31A isoform X1 [Hylaeus anthracinus]XP_054008174.1 protein transport protein Sec31A isoform X1 [Hylaeus anthracinus]